MIKSKKLSKFKEIKHGFFNRQGGKSKGIYKSLNCGIGSSDAKKNVKNNLKIVCKKIDCFSNKLILLNQIHSNKFYFINENFKSDFNKRGLSGKLIIPKLKYYKKLKHKIKNHYLKLDINNENMSHVLALSKLLKIKDKILFKSLNSFEGLPHRYEIFLRKRNCIFINDSKATSFISTKFALQNSHNIFWIVGGLPKKNDKINLRNLKRKIIKSYIPEKVKFFIEKKLI